MLIRYYCHLGILTGYGVAAEKLAMTLLAAGVELEIRPLMPYEQVVVNPDLPLSRCIRRDTELTANPDVVLVHTLPFDCQKVVSVAEEAMGKFPSGTSFIAYTTWEGHGNVPAELVRMFDLFDQVWVPSHHNRSAFAYGFKDAGYQDADDRVRVVPHAFDPQVLPAWREPRSHAGETFRFYYLGEWNSRKNPEGVMRAFVRAFTKDEPVSLTIRSKNATEEDFILAWHRTGISPKDSPRIQFANRPLPDDGIRELHRIADCFVSATRGEAWNLPAFEAMMAGRHVICPVGMGSDDFLNFTSADLYGGIGAPAACDAKVVRLPLRHDVAGNDQLGISVDYVHGLTCRTEWKEPDLRALANLMRRVFVSAQRDIKLDYDLAAKFGYDAVARTVKNHLEAL